MTSKDFSVRPGKEHNTQFESFFIATCNEADPDWFESKQKSGGHCKFYNHSKIRAQTSTPGLYSSENKVSSVKIRIAKLTFTKIYQLSMISIVQQPSQVSRWAKGRNRLWRLKIYNCDIRLLTICKTFLCLCTGK